MTHDIQELAELVGRTGYLSYGKLDFPVVILAVKVGGYNRVLVEVTPVASYRTPLDYYGTEWKDINSIRGLDGVSK